MKSRLLIIIVLTILIVGSMFAGFFLYQQEYNKNCIDDGNRVTGFLRCTGFNCDFDIPVGVVGVSIPKGAFNPEKNRNIYPETIVLELGANNTVMWINHDRESIVFTADDDSWTTGEIFSCTSKKITFDQTGIFEYSSESYPWLNGKIIIDDKNEHEGMSENTSEVYVDEQIDRIFKRCDYQKRMNERNWIGLDGNKIRDHQPQYGWENSTHYLDNNTCEWQERK